MTGHSQHSKNEETRKLQITGGSTYVISLPKKWVTQNRLEKGSPLLIRQEENGSLEVLPPEIARPEKSEEALITVGPEDNSDEIIRKTVSVYLLGYNIIHIRAKNQKEILSTQRSDLKTLCSKHACGNRNSNRHLHSLDLTSFVKLSRVVSSKCLASE